MIDRFKENFREEAVELLENLEDDLLRLEDAPEDSELIGAVFRAIHTVKGSASMFGFTSASRFAHEVEMTLDRLRDGEFLVSRPFIDALLLCRDHILDMVGKNIDESDEADAVSRKLADGLAASAVSTARPAAVKTPAGETAIRTVRIRFKPGKDLFRQGSKPLLLIRELTELGDLSVKAHPGTGLEDFSSMDPESCDTSWEFFLSTSQELNAVKDVFIFVEDESEIEYSVLDAGDAEDGDEVRLGEILVRGAGVDPEDIGEGLKEQKPLGEILLDKKKVSSEELDSALEAQKHMRSVRERSQAVSSRPSVRVDAHKLDDLIDLVGELVTMQARLFQNIRSESRIGLWNVSEELERLVIDLRETTMSIRMLPIGTTFSRYKRLVRDLAGELNKEVELIARGGETELDKTVLDKLNDPLVHLIRNSLDHGIEDPETRSRRNKHPLGRIVLSAEHAGAAVLISIEDDGAGLDRDAILRKAESRGLVREGAELSSEEIFQFIFHPGFSTAKEVTSVSGRGVGMDVVQRQITDLGGTIRLESVRNAYTRIVLELPLTLAIIEGMLVRSGSDYFVFPLSAVESCIELNHLQRENEVRSGMLTFRERMLPFSRLRDMFDISGDLPDIEQVVIVNVNSQQIGFVVDQVIGGHQTVIKNLGRVYQNVPGVSGATILGDGSVALILDPARLAVDRRSEDSA